MNSTHFLSIDLIDIKKNLNQFSDIYNFLDNLLIKLSLKQINKPVLVPYYHGKIANDCGISCYAFFEGGYSTFHIFEKRNIAYFDIMSNKEFDSEIISCQLKNFCKPKNVFMFSNNQTTITNSPKLKDFGPHYIGSGKVKRGFGIAELLSLQNEIIDKIEMTPIISPVIVQNSGQTLLFIAIAESHIALTLEKNQLRIDIFSCKMFDLNKLKTLLSNHVSISKETIYTRKFLKK